MKGKYHTHSQSRETEPKTMTWGLPSSVEKKTEAEEPTYFNDAIIKLTKTIRKKEMKNRIFSKIETVI